MDDISDINIIIGKNNSGKSTILQTLDLIFSEGRQIRIPESLYLIHNKQEKVRPKIDLKVEFSEEELQLLFKFPGSITTPPGKERFEMTFDDFPELLKSQNFVIQLDILTIFENQMQESDLKKIKIIDELAVLNQLHIARQAFIEKQLGGISGLLKQYLDKKILLKLFRRYKSKYIPMVRSIAREEGNPERPPGRYFSGGKEVTLLIHEYLTREGRNRNLIKRNIRDAINEILPDLEVQDLFTQREEKDNEIEVYLELANGFTLPLSCFGSGLADLILFLINFTIDIEKYSLIFIEEPENQFHPTLQRRFYELLKTISEDKDIQFFLSTHSTYFLNFKELENVYRTSLKDGEAAISQYKPPNTDQLEEHRILSRIFNVKSTQAFFADKVILVEDINDALVLSHFAGELGFKLEEDNVFFLDVGGKFNFKHYQSLFESYDIPIYVIADCDVLIEGLDQILPDYGESSQKTVRKLREDLLTEIDEEKKARKISLFGEDYKEFLDKPLNNKDKFYRILEIFEKGKGCEPLEKEDRKFVKYLFELEPMKKRARIVKEISSPTKEELIETLAQKNIFILRQGSIEDYYPDEIDTKNKTKAALQAVKRMRKVDIISKGVIPVKGRIKRLKRDDEFGLIFEAIKTGRFYY